MLLQDKFYTILDVARQADDTVRYRVALNPDCEVYQGHFPGKPVCPGVCNIEMIRECAELLTGRKLRISTIGQCRFKAVASPAVCPELNVTLSVQAVEGGYKVIATIADDDTVYMELKGEMTL